MAPRPRLQPGVRQHVHQDLVGPHALHEEGREEGEEEGREEECEEEGISLSAVSGGQRKDGGGRPGHAACVAVADNKK